MAGHTEAGHVAEMTALLNAIVAQGGTTAREVAADAAGVDADYVGGASVVCCSVALRDGQVAGFQSVGLHPDLPHGWGDIGTYVALGSAQGGIGSALFAATSVAARARGLVALNATIRADNTGGLAYYARMGFQDYGTTPAITLQSGQVVGRVSKRLVL